jgi:hypothetical protein
MQKRCRRVRGPALPATADKTSSTPPGRLDARRAFFNIAAMRITIDSADRRFLKRIVFPLVVLCGLYILSYVALSRLGAYAPWITSPAQDGGRYAKLWVWAPLGTYDPKTGGSLWLEEFYSPLLTADRHHWHTKLYPDAGDPRYDLP